MNYYDIFQRMCMMRKIPEDDLCRYLDQLLGKQNEKKQELSKQFAEEVRDRYPVRKKMIHLLQLDDLGSYPGDKKLASAVEKNCLAEFEKEIPTDEDAGICCSREELDKYIEHLIEVVGFERAPTDLVDAYALLETEADGDPDRMPNGIGVIPFVEAWNEYVTNNPVREKVMFTWNQFFSLPERIQHSVIFLWEMEYADHRPTLMAFGYGDDDEYDDARMFDVAEMYNWLKEYGSPHACELETGNDMLEEYCQTGNVKSCPICGGEQVMKYGHAFMLNGSLTLICPKCGVVGHYFGTRDIHNNADTSLLHGNAQINDSPYIPWWANEQKTNAETES